LKQFISVNDVTNIDALVQKALAIKLILLRQEAWRQ